MQNQGAFQTLRHTLSHSVMTIRHLTHNAYVLRCSRKDLQYRPGQHISVGPENDLNMREYSIYSGIEEPFLEILVKEIEEGYVSKKLKRLNPGDEIKIEGPFGSFIIEEHEFNAPLYMIGTGTGIAPYHCFALSYPTLPCTILHGVRTHEQLYEHHVFDSPHITFIPCLSTKDTSQLPSKANFLPFQGRVTDYLRAHPIDKDGIYFLCGNCDMIYEAYDILHMSDVPSEQIKAEVYF